MVRVKQLPELVHQCITEGGVTESRSNIAYQFPDLLSQCPGQDDVKPPTRSP